MSVTIDYFFNYPRSLSELTTDINDCLGCSLAPYKSNPEDLFTRFLSMEFSLRVSPLALRVVPPDFEKDPELDFENYLYKLDFRTPWGGAADRPIQLPAILMVVYALHRYLGITGMLVYDIQIPLAHYEERETDGYGKRLFDRVSDTYFVSFEAHLATVSKRLPDSWQTFYGRESIS